MGILLALASACSWGAGDFVAGLTSRRTSSLAIVVSSQALGVVLLLALAPLAGGSADGASLAWGAAGGVGSGLGLALLYHALAVGPMTVVAPVAAVVAVIAPVAFGLASGDGLSSVASTGIALAVAAVVLVSMPAADAAAPAAAPVGGPAAGMGPARRRPTVQPRALLAALGAGAGFGVFYICFARTGADSGLWPVVGARGATVAVLGALAVAVGQSPVVPSSARAATALVGVLDSAAQALYLLATREAVLSIVSVISSLYPAVTVVLAGVVLREPVTRRQLLALLVAALGVTLIVLG